MKELLASDRRSLVVFGFAGAVKALGLVLLAEGLARGIVGVIAGDDWRGPVALVVLGGILRACTGWFTQSFAARAAIGTKEKLRAELADRVLAGGSGRTGSLAAVATVGLDELDAWYRTMLPALATTATVPLLVGARILSVDWLSALVIVLTVPLVPLFMALVGMHTKQQSDAATATLQRLSDHLVELARGLPVLVGLGRVADQSAALARISTDHRATTMRTLRSAFLSSLVLELISTISVAVVAVSVGIRLIHGDLPLVVGLVALVLAPECFAPFRELGSAFHASQDGLSARRRVRELIDAPLLSRAISDGPDVAVADLTIRYDGRADAVTGVSFTLPRGTITVIDGSSGSGKSSVLGVLAGTIAAASGTVRGIDPALVAYVPQHPHTVGETVAEELALYAGPLGARDILERLGLGGLDQADPARLSPGELRRLAVARAILRVEDGAELLLLDEPTAHLDASSAALVERELQRLRAGVTVLIASHEAGVASLAERRIVLDATRRRDVAAPVLPAARTRSEPPKPHVSAVRELLAFLRPSLWRTIAAALLGTGATLFGIALLAVSAWLIVRASEEPAIMYLLVAIVGVRFFGLGRAGLRYAERLLTHDAALTSVTALRLRLWVGLAARGTASRGLARGGVALDYLVAAADRVRDLVPRVVATVLVATLSAAAVLVAVAALESSLLPVFGALLAAAVVGCVVALRTDRAASQTQAIIRSTVLRRFAGMVGAAGELRANGVGTRVRDAIGALDARAGLAARRSAGALGLGGAIVIFASSVAAALVIALSVGGSTSGAIVAVLVFLPLGLIDPLLGLVDAVQQWPTLAAALRTAGTITAEPETAVGDRPITRIETLELQHLGATWPGADAPAFDGVSASAERGDWIVVEGASGAGKSTLLATVLGYLAPSSGRVLLNGLDAREFANARSRMAWCPQDAHLFDSTIRANLLLARDHDDKPTDAELTEALRKSGLGVLLATLPQGLDTRVGSEGASLSGGQRQRLAVARALLSRADVVLLDEPTAHLDAEGAESLMTDLRAALSDRIVVLITHHAAELRPSDVRVRLSVEVPDLGGVEPHRALGGVLQR